MRGNTRCTPSAPKKRAVLAILLLHANQFIPVDLLVEVLWGGHSPTKAIPALHVYIAALRKALAPGCDRHPQPLIETWPNGYRLCADPERIDLYRFHGLAEQGDRAMLDGRPDQASTLLGTALRIWRGPALADIAGIGLLRTYADGLDNTRLAVLERRIEADLRLGRHALVADELETLCRRHPLRESMHRQLIIAQLRSGRRADALASYQRIRRELIETLGLEPGETLQSTLQAVLRGAEPDHEQHPQGS
ncbi:BTAD domain-containing putative transcriptional regulator [Amycolatopsis sp. NPDC059021]|uniref:AfsR/SARP family transcriptional regulator n=1 Tax=Amycolatopsis sp. NPDC059021 TaxID=3346704 RepID=UPI00366CD48C